MINQDVANNEGNLFRCHYTFFAAMICASAIAIFAFALVVGLLSQGGYGLAIFSCIMLLVFLWAIFIFYREDRILACLIVRAELVNSALHVKTIFGKVAVLDRYEIINLDLSWLKRRRIWPSYFMQSSGSKIYPRYNWQDIKCVSVSSGGGNFYWVTEGKSSGIESVLRVN